MKPTRTLLKMLVVFLGILAFCILAAPQCPEPGCRDNGGCPDAEFCAKTTGDCEGVGNCEARPGDCPDGYVPVCGCDGLTYPSECDAHVAGINVAYDGACDGVRCRTDQDCQIFGNPLPWFCQLAVGDCDGTGTCQIQPMSCPDIWMPVCGCDGSTYGNDCDAHAAAVNIAYAGECDPAACDPSECAGPQPGMPNWECPDGSWGGPVCQRDATGNCTWQIRECPEQ